MLSSLFNNQCCRCNGAENDHAIKCGLRNESCGIEKFQHFQHTGQTDIQRGNGLLAADDLTPAFIRLHAGEVNEILIAVSMYKLAVQIFEIVDFNDLKTSIVLL